MKKIIHVDMDYFYAQVEELERPELKELPVGIGGGKRGVLCTCNYIARSFGVRSAMPSFMAKKLCPDIIFLRPQFSKYKEMSEKIFHVFTRYTKKIQALSLDEAYLDVTECDLFGNDAVKIAKKIKADILQETGLTASAGVSYNKLLAKIGSDLFKPNGLAILRPQDIEKNIAHFPIEKIWGIGKVGSKKMHAKGLHTFGDLQQKSKLDLVNLYGDFGNTLFNYCRGIDHREVASSRIRKSLSVENTFFDNVHDYEDLQLKMYETFDELKARLNKHKDKLIKNIFVKIKYHDFKSTTIESQDSVGINCFQSLLERRWGERPEPVRLLGIGVKFHVRESRGQLEFEF